MKNFIDSSKKGTIILSHYRAGGTQMRQIVQRLLDNKGIPSIDCGEVNVDVSKLNLLEQVDNQFYNNDPTYKIVLLNNPLIPITHGASHSQSCKGPA